jgi:hypothetical protein
VALTLDLIVGESGRRSSPVGRGRTARSDGGGTSSTILRLRGITAEVHRFEARNPGLALL